MTRAVLSALFLQSCLLSVESLHAQNPAETFFEKQVRPIFVERCHDCHSEDNAESELRVDSLAGLLNGGLRGPAIVPGEPEKSLLIRAVRHGELLKMPAKKKLPATEIAALAKWVKDGAVWPDAKAVAAPATNNDSSEYSFTDEQRSFWAFQPPRRSPLPDVRNRDWPRSPIDWFILAPLEQAGYGPAPRAERRTLFRRAALALTGLAPTPAELQSFLADESPDALERAVDRLLNSPLYGERWGRHWLDVVRYADSNGLDENLAHANAFRYRDYVIAAMNHDKPIDLFVQEQLAGDQLEFPGETNAAILARLPATGFLSIGPKMLAEDDPVKMQMDIIDEQIDTIGRAFLGLTFGCARCHDHKFDPIPTADYYSLAGIFKSTHTMDTLTVVAKWHERPLATPEAVAAQKSHQKKIEALVAETASIREAAGKSVRDQAISQTGDYLIAAENRRREQKWFAEAKPFGNLKEGDRPDGSLFREAESFERGNVSRDTTSYGKGIGVLVNMGPTPNFTEYDIEVKTPGRYQIEVRYAAAASRPTLLIVNDRLIRKDIADGVTGTWFPDSQRWEIEGFVELKEGKNVLRLEQPTFFPHIDKLLLVPVASEAISELTPLVAARAPVASYVTRWVEFLNSESPAQPDLMAAWNRLAAKTDQPEPLREFARSLETFVAGDEQASRAAESRLPFDDADAVRDFILSEKSPFHSSAANDAELPAETVARLKSLQEKQSKLEKEMPQLPSVMAVEDGTIEDVRIHYRGSHLTQGAVIPRRFPRILAGDEQPKIAEGRSGRLEFARWLTSRNNPLAARVFVNRVWQWHFGAGLVRTPDNFGRLGERPTHPELLDWLAVEFMDSGWSLKHLHKLILLSSTWQQSMYPASSTDALTSVSQSAGVIQKSLLDTDPENRLWGRMNRRRLTAEEIRDAILVLSGELEQTMGGTMLPTANRAYVTSTANVNPDVYRSDRRSVYLPVVRSALYEVFQAFDFADPSVLTGKRQSTTVAPQALFMMNSEFVSQHTRTLAERLLADGSPSDSERIGQLWMRAFGRAAGQQEQSGAMAFLAAYEESWRQSRPESAAESRLRAWQSLCRAVIATNEFLYVE